MIQENTNGNLIPRITFRHLSEILRSPAHYFYKFLSGNHKPKDDSKATFAAVVRCMLQTPGEFTKRFYVASTAIDRRTKEGRQQWLEWCKIASGKRIISKPEYLAALEVKSEVRENEIIRKIYSDGVANKEFHFVDSWHNMECSATAGWLYSGSMIVQIQMVDDASPAGFAKFCKYNNLFIKSAWLNDGFEVATGGTCSGVIFVAIEEKPPYGFAMYQLDSMDLEIGRQTYIDGLERIKTAVATGIWEGYSPKIEKLNVFKY